MNPQRTFIFFFLVIASSTNYTYSSTKWRKVNNSNSTIIDKLFLQGQGKISSFEANSNNLKFSMEQAQNNKNGPKQIKVYAYLPPFPFDGSKISECVFQNIPIRLWVYFGSQSSGQISQIVVTESITFEFTETTISFYLQGGKYTLELLTTALQPFATSTTESCILSFNFMNQLLIIGVITTKGLLLYRFSTLFNTLAAYEVFILIRNYQLENISYLFLKINIGIACTGPLILLTFLMLRPPITFKRILLVLALLAYSTLIALGYIGEIFILIEIFLQQARITTKYLANRYRHYFDTSCQNQDALKILLGVIIYISLSRSILIVCIRQGYIETFYDYHYFHLCLLLLIVVANETFILKEPSLMIRLRARFRRKQIIKTELKYEDCLVEQ